VDVNADGTILSYGAPGGSGTAALGEVFVWKKPTATGAWVQYGATLKGPTPAAGQASMFGSAVSLGDSATYLAVGSPDKTAGVLLTAGSWSVYLSTATALPPPPPPVVAKPPPPPSPPPAVVAKPPPPPAVVAKPPPPPPLKPVVPAPPPPPPVDSGPKGICVWLAKNACDELQAEGQCVRIPRKPKCLPSPTNGGTCNDFSYAAKKVKGRRKACERAGCVWEKRVVTPPGQGTGHCVPKKP